MMSIIIYFLVFRKINVLILIIFCQSSVLKWQNYTILFKKYTTLSLTEKRFFEKIFVLRLKINKFSVIIFRIPQKKYFLKDGICRHQDFHAAYGNCFIRH